MSTTICVTPSDVWQTTGPRGVVAYLVPVPVDFRPTSADIKPEALLQVACTVCGHVALLGSAWTYRYNAVLYALSIELPRAKLCAHDGFRFFRFAKKEGSDGG